MPYPSYFLCNEWDPGPQSRCSASASCMSEMYKAGASCGFGKAVGVKPKNSENIAIALSLEAI